MSDLAEKLIAAARHISQFNEIKDDIDMNNRPPDVRYGESMCPLELGYINTWEPTWAQKHELFPHFGWPTTQWDGTYAFYLIEGVKFLFQRELHHD